MWEVRLMFWGKGGMVEFIIVCIGIFDSLILFVLSKYRSSKCICEVELRLEDS